MPPGDPIRSENPPSQPVTPRPVNPASAGRQPARPVPASSSRPANGAPQPVAVPAAAAPVPIPPGSNLPRQRQEEPPEGENRPWGVVEMYLRSSPPWLVSALIQMILIIVLGLWMLPPRKETGVELNVSYADQLGDELADDFMDLDSPNELEESLLTPQNLEPVEDPFAAPPTVAVTLEGSTPIGDIEAPQIGLALSGRSEGSKQALLEAYGGNAQSEAAVRLAIEWLIKQQQKDGSWSLSGPYADGVSLENTTAATAMALLAIQGNGHTHQRGLYQSQVERGVKYLLKMQLEDGSFFRENVGSSRLYTQGQCTIALCELYGMTEDSALRGPCERAVKFCVESQDSQGGWRYIVGQDSDTSVTGWIAMALQSARMAGLDVPEQTLVNIGRYLDKAGNAEGTRYGYTAGSEPTEIMTAEAMLCRQYLGWRQNDPRMADAAEFLLREENLPNWGVGRNVYYWYYATQFLHHLEGEPWERWNAVTRDLLVSKQNRSGRERGSWDPIRPLPDRWGPHAGRLYVTCLSVYILEVYYRHLPIYSQIDLLN